MARANRPKPMAEPSAFETRGNAMMTNSEIVEAKTPPKIFDVEVEEIEARVVVKSQCPC